MNQTNHLSTRERLDLSSCRRNLRDDGGGFAWPLMPLHSPLCLQRTRPQLSRSCALRLGVHGGVNVRPSPAASATGVGAPSFCARTRYCSRSPRRAPALFSLSRILLLLRGDGTHTPPAPFLTGSRSGAFRRSTSAAALDPTCHVGGGSPGGGAPTGPCLDRGEARRGNLDPRGSRGGARAAAPARLLCR